MPTINWLYAQAVTGAIEFPQTWHSRGILLAISDAAAPGWRIMGKLRIEALIEKQFYRVATRSIEYGDSLIEIPYSAYRLSFLPAERTKSAGSIQIKIAAIDPNMQVSYPPSQVPALTSPIYRSVSAPTGADALHPFLLCEPRARRAALLTNKTGVDIYIREGQPTVELPLIASDPFTKIPNGAQYVVDEWSGYVAGICAAVPAAGGKVLVKEMLYANPDIIPLPVVRDIVPAPALKDLPIAYGGFNLEASNADRWINQQGQSTSVGGFAEVFVVEGRIYGRNPGNDCYSSPGNVIAYAAVSMAEYKIARLMAETIIQCANALPLP